MNYMKHDLCFKVENTSIRSLVRIIEEITKVTSSNNKMTRIIDLIFIVSCVTIMGLVIANFAVDIPSLENQQNGKMGVRIGQCNALTKGVNICI